MSILNRSPEYNHLYDSEGRLQGGLHALEELARVIAIGSGGERDRETMDEDNDETEPALELPISTASRNSPSLIDSDEDMSSDDDDPGSSDDDAMEEIAMYDDPSPLKDRSTSPLPLPPMIVPSSPNAASLPSPSEIAAQGAALSNSFHSSDSDSLRTKTSTHSRRSSRRRTVDNSRESLFSVGERLKKRFLDVDVLTTLLVSGKLMLVVVVTLTAETGLIF
jgi:serine/threonine-protein phosphatase 6 regulatory subunit 3